MQETEYNKLVLKILSETMEYLVDKILFEVNNDHLARDLTYDVFFSVIACSVEYFFKSFPENENLIIKAKSLENFLKNLILLQEKNLEVNEKIN